MNVTDWLLAAARALANGGSVRTEDAEICQTQVERALSHAEAHLQGPEFAPVLEILRDAEEQWANAFRLLRWAIREDAPEMSAPIAEYAQNAEEMLRRVSDLVGEQLSMFDQESELH